jgi:hypothetical protein
MLDRWILLWVCVCVCVCVSEKGSLVEGGLKVVKGVGRMSG